MSDLRAIETQDADDALGLLLELCERRPAEVDGAVLIDRFYDEGRLLIDTGALRQISIPGTVVCRECEHLHPAEVEFDPHTKTYWQHCPEAGWVDVLESDMLRYQVDFDWLVDRLSKSLNISGEWRPKCLLEDVLWDLGEGRAGEHRVDSAVRPAARQQSGRSIRRARRSRRQATYPQLLHHHPGQDPAGHASPRSINR